MNQVIIALMMDRDSFDVTLIKQQFLCCTPLNKFNFTIVQPIDINRQKEIIDNTINSNLVKRYPIKKSYQQAFLKLLIEKLEMSSGEVCDSVYDAYCNLITHLNEKTTHFRHYLMEGQGNLDCITVQENTNIISEGTTGLCCWQAAVALSEWCMENKDQFEEKTVLELGCGVGLTGLTIINSCSPKQYIFSDCHESVLKRTCTNVELNLYPHRSSQSVQPSLPNRLKLQFNYEDTNVQVVELNWGDIEKYIKENMPSPEIIIAADILYENSAFHDLIAGLKMFLAMKCSYAIIAATVRNKNTMEEFLELLASQSLIYEECTLLKQPISIQSIDAPVQILKIYKSRK